MKKLFIVMFVVLFAATAAYAETEISISGMYNVRGSYFKNVGGVQTDESSGSDPEVSYPDPVTDYSFYDHELDADIAITIEENTFVNLNLEIHDETWVESPAAELTGDDNIQFKRVWGGHTFGTGTKLEAGLMTGSSFGHGFGDTSDGYYRIKVTQALGGNGVLIGIVEKREEVGDSNKSIEDAEKDDGDMYALAWVGSVGEHTLGFLAEYIDNSNAISGKDNSPTPWVDPSTGAPVKGDSDGVEVTAFVAYGAGELGQLGYEWEFDYLDFSYDKPLPFEDTTVWGVYANVWINPAPFKLGALVAYGNWDDDGGETSSEGAGFDLGDVDYGLLWDVLARRK